MKRLINKVAWHDVKFRDRAILYIDGEFVEANTHNIALTNWTYDNNIRRNSGQSGVARGNLVNEMANNRQLRDMPYACLHKLEIDPQTNEKRKMIFIDPETIYGIDLNELANLTKQKYPDYEIFEDSEQFTPEETDKYTKLAKNKFNIKKAFHDYGERDCAVVYLDGKFYEGDFHSEIVSDILEDDSVDQIFRDELYKLDRNKENNLPFACLHKVTKLPMKGTKVKAIYIDTNTLENISLNELIDEVKKQYPDFDVFEEDDDIQSFEYDEYKKIARSVNVKRLIRKSNHVGPLSHEDVEKDVIDTKRTKIRDGQDDFLMAKQLVCDSVLTPTNENFLFVRQMINEGKFSDLGKFNDDYENWITRCQDLAKEKGILRN